MMRSLAPALVAVALAPLIACGEDGGALPPDPTFDAEITENPCGGFCDDGDWCTEDLCTAEGCIFVPRNPFGACQTAAHCDDDNPCTDDVCALDECGLMRCDNSRWREGCQPCNFGGWCDDGDPCTPDTCGADGICTTGPRDRHCDTMCRQDWAMSAYEAQWMWPSGESTVYFVGAAEPQFGPSCDDGACSCQRALTLAESGFGLELRDISGLEDPPFSCEVDACDTRSASCAPLERGVGYVVWGVMRFLTRFEAPARAEAGAADTAAPPLQPIDHLAVQGYCLSIRHDHLLGHHEGRLEADGQEARFSVAIGWEDDGFTTAHLSACTGCEVVGLAPDQEAALAPEPGVVSLPLTLAGGASGHVRLYARADHLIGDVLDGDGRFVGVMTLRR